MVLSKNYARFADKEKFILPSEAVLHVHQVLTGIIHEGQYRELYGTDIAYPVAQVILRLYVSFGGSSEKAEPYLNQIEGVCAFEGPKFGEKDSIDRPIKKPFSSKL